MPGDVLEIVFRNNLNSSTNIVPSGVVTNTTAAAAPGQTVSYEWKVGQEVCAGPPVADMHANRQMLCPLLFCSAILCRLCA